MQKPQDPEAQVQKLSQNTWDPNPPPRARSHWLTLELLQKPQDREAQVQTLSQNTWDPNPPGCARSHWLTLEVLQKASLQEDSSAKVAKRLQSEGGP